MKRESKVLLMIIILGTVFFCPVINVYSNNNIQTTIIAHPTVDNYGENNTFTDIDFFDDEQINQIADFQFEANYIHQIRIPQNCILISRYPTIIWQPPKNVLFNV